MAETFSSRVADVFAALDAHDPHSKQPEWSVRGLVPAASGDAHSAESEEEGDEHSERIEVLKQVEQQEGGSLKLQDRMPSVSACKAFEAEEEEDAFDRVAADSLHGLDMAQRPALDTQVADEADAATGWREHVPAATASDDTFSDPALASPGSHMQVEGPSTASLVPIPASPPRPLRSTLKKPSPHLNSTAKRVRFSETVGVHTIDADDEPGTVSPLRYQRLEASLSQESSEDDEEFSVDGAALEMDDDGDVSTSLVDDGADVSAPPLPMPQPTSNSQRQSVTPAAIDEAAPRRSYVPEYVRRPEAFTCYALDAPIVVGSGDDGATAEQRAAGQAAVPQSGRYVASGGGGAAVFEATGVARDAEMDDDAGAPVAIDFVPRCDREGAGGATSDVMLEASVGVGTKTSRGAVSFGDADEAEASVDGDGAGGLEAKPQRKRLRARSGDGDQE